MYVLADTGSQSLSCFDCLGLVVIAVMFADRGILLRGKRVVRVPVLSSKEKHMLCQERDFKRERGRILDHFFAIDCHRRMVR
jgi:hypothetical protein